MSAARRPRLLLLAPAFGVLAIGALAGLVRIGWPSAPAPGAAVAAHGPLMVGGFFGTLIALERAVAVGKRWTFLGPGCSLAAALAMALGADPRAAAVLMAVGSLFFVLASVSVYRRQKAAFTAMLLAGSAAWLYSSVLACLSRPIPELVPGWIAFLALTIGGERLEMSRLLPQPKWARRAFTGASVLVGVACVLALFVPAAGARLLGISLIALSAWVARYDLGRRTFRSPGLPRFMAVSLFGGYGWQAVAGIIALVAGRFSPGPMYDAAIHATFLGLGFSMVFGHAPVVFPAVVGLPVPYSRALYAPLALLHVSVAWRVTCDLAGLYELRRWAGLLNALSLLSFVLVVLVSILTARRPAPRRTVAAA